MMSVPPYTPPLDEYPQTYEAPRTGMATTSLVLGIISVPTICACVGPLLGLVAVILGLVAVVRAGGQPERFGGKGRAIGGIISGVVGILLVIPTIAMGMAVLATGGVASTAANMQNIGLALQSYGAVYDDYPPALAVLDETGMIQKNPLDAAADPKSGVTYVVGVKPGDPADWIVAYAETSFWTVPLVGVAYADGRSNMLEATEFAQDLASFQEEYKADRGEPPTIVKPAGEP